MPEQATRPVMSRRSLFGAVAVGGIGLSAIGAFLFTENRIGPTRLTARRIIDGLKSTGGGNDSGARANHAKGFAVSGYFESNGAGKRLSKASVFSEGRHTLKGRFSLGGADPKMPDAPQAPRGLGLSISAGDGQEWRTAMVNVPVFLDATAQEFYDRTLAFSPDSVTGQPDPSSVAAYLSSHSSTAAALKIIEAGPQTNGFTDATFYGLHAFAFTGGLHSAPVRWKLVPHPSNAPTPPPLPSGDPAGHDTMFTALARGLRHGPLRWNLVLIEGIWGVDPTHDATQQWPAARNEHNVGTIVIDRAAPPSSVDDISFDPLILPEGIGPSDDPLLPARSATYAESMRRRSGQSPTGQALQSEAVR